MRCSGCQNIITYALLGQSTQVCRLTRRPIADYETIGCVMGKFHQKKEWKKNNNKSLENEPLREKIVIDCLAICKDCHYYREDQLTNNNSEAPTIIRLIGNTIKTVADFMKLDVGFRCGKCGCFGTFKAKLLRGRGCPLKKWPNDE